MQWSSPLPLLQLLALLVRCSSRTVLDVLLAAQHGLTASEAEPVGFRTHPVALVAVDPSPDDATLNISVPFVRHSKLAGAGYAIGSPLYFKQLFRDNSNDLLPSHPRDDSENPLDEKKEEAAKEKKKSNTLPQVNMIPIVVCYISAVSIFMSASACFIITRRRTKASDTHLVAFRKREDDEAEEKDKDKKGCEKEPDVENGDDKLFGKDSEEQDVAVAEPEIDKSRYFSMHTDDLVDVMGLSGMSLLEMDARSGVSGLPLLYSLFLCSLQAWSLQFVILFYMARRVYRLCGGVEEEGAAAEPVPFSIIFAAIYLHFINCMNDLPFSVSIVRHIGELHMKNSHIALALPVFLVDGLIVPVTSLIVGALYLCTSATVADVILNSCAVAFISNIDNWILALNEKLNQAAGDEVLEEDFKGMKSSEGMRVFIPVNHELVKSMSWWMCQVPIVPAVFSWVFGYLGLYVMEL